MASLSARGCTILARVSFEQAVPTDELIMWRKDERAYRSDGTILARRVVRFKPDGCNPEGRRHDYGWTVLQQVKKMVLPLTPEKWLRHHESKGWNKVK